MQEVFAGFLEHIDAQIGKLVDADTSIGGYVVSGSLASYVVRPTGFLSGIGSICR